MRAFICEKDNCDGVERFCFRYLLLIITLIRVYLVSLVMLTVEKNKTKKKKQILKTETLNRMPCCENVYKATEGVEQS